MVAYKDATDAAPRRSRRMSKPYSSSVIGSLKHAKCCRLVLAPYTKPLMRDASDFISSGGKPVSKEYLLRHITIMDISSLKNRGKSQPSQDPGSHTYVPEMVTRQRAGRAREQAGWAAPPPLSALSALRQAAHPGLATRPRPSWSARGVMSVASRLGKPRSTKSIGVGSGRMLADSRSSDSQSYGDSQPYDSRSSATPTQFHGVDSTRGVTRGMSPAYPP
jgi:hypothetical protein